MFAASIARRNSSRVKPATAGSIKMLVSQWLDSKSLLASSLSANEFEMALREFLESLV